MCGIVGAAGDLWGKHEKALRTLLILDSLRGEDSTGICAVGKHDGVARVVKRLGDHFQLFDTKAFDKAFNRSNRLVIGHNRYATSGAVTARNAHPFENEWLVGVHNGTLTNKWKLADERDFSVDSENLYHHIMKHGLRHAIDIVEGAYALVWWDKAEETLNMLRNKERPLYFTITEDSKVMFWASEAWMLMTALGRHDIKYKEISMVEPDLHFSVHINAKGEMLKPIMVPMAQPERPVVVHQPYRYTPPVTSGTQQPQTSSQTGVKTTTGTVVNITQNKSASSPAVVGGTQEKKPQEGGHITSPQGKPYINAKGVRLEMLSKNRDQHGSEYVLCFDVTNPHTEIRWYFKKNDAIANFIGEDIIADINEHAHGPHGSYYKVSAWTVQLAIPDAAAGCCELPSYYLSASGHAMTKKEWLDTYKDCNWCSDPLDPDLGTHRFSTQGECFCAGCADNAQVSQYVSLK